MKSLIVVGLLLIFMSNIFAQDSIVYNGNQKFYHANGKLASEGIMHDGKPDGFWRTYDENGKLRSEGNRKNYLLDSIWNFYNESGDITLSITYKNDLKNGYRTTYLPDKILVDSFENDVKNNWNRILYLNKKTKIRTFYIKGLENGWSYQYAEDGRIVIKTLFKNGFIKKREYINGYNVQGKKQGLWKEFYENENTKWEGTFRNGIKDGYFKYYDFQGNIIKIEKYRNGIIESDPIEITSFEVRTDYYSNGNVKISGSYLNDLAEGVRREYTIDGKISDGYLMHQGVIIGHGIIDESGKKQGKWIHYYDNGSIESEGSYVDNVKRGLWTFYFENGNIEETGSFDALGQYNGDWKWYYKDGSIRIVEFYFEGEQEGKYSEYDVDGTILLEGTYVNGIREGEWISTVHGYIEKGSYLENVRDGIWKFYYAKDSLYFEGNFIDGSEDGVHTWYHRNGQLMLTGRYMMSLKEGDWKYYDEYGHNLLRIKYKDGIEKEYNAIRIEPDMDLKDFQE